MADDSADEAGDQQGINTRRGTSSRLRYAPPLAVTPSKGRACWWRWQESAAPDQQQGGKSHKAATARDRV